MAKIGWTKDKMLIIAPSTNTMYRYDYDKQPDLMEMLKKQLKQTEKESINSNKAFAEFVSDKKDISVFYSSEKAMNLWGDMISQMTGYGYGDNEMTAALSGLFNKFTEQVKGINTAGFISFEKGEIVAENKVYYDSPESEKRFTELVGQLTKELKGDQIKYFAEKPLIMASMGLNGGGIYDYINDLGVMKMIQSAAGSELEEMGIDLKSLISNVDGDFTFALNDVKTVMKKSYYGDYEYPTTQPEFSAFADLKDAKSTWNLIRTKIKETTIWTKV